MTNFVTTSSPSAKNAKYIYCSITKKNCKRLTNFKTPPTPFGVDVVDGWSLRPLLYRTVSFELKKHTTLVQTYKNNCLQ